MVRYKNNKYIVFDMDDVMWDCNGRSARIAGVDPKKHTTFSVYENENFTEDEKNRMLAAYLNPDTYRNITFNMWIINMINRLHQECPEYPVMIVSNCMTQEIKDIKMPQLQNVLDIPTERIQLNVIDMKTQHKDKKLPKGIFILVDDSPYNIVLGDAIHRIMPAKIYNNVLNKHGYLNKLKIYRTKNDDELKIRIMECIRIRRILSK